MTASILKTPGDCRRGRAERHGRGRRGGRGGAGRGGVELDRKGRGEKKRGTARHTNQAYGQNVFYVVLFILYITFLSS